MSNQFSKLAIPYEEYFAEMDITDAQKRKRISLAKSFEEFLLLVFQEITKQIQGFDKLNMIYQIDTSYFEGYISSGILNVLNSYGYSQLKEPYLFQYANDLAFMIMATTMKHPDETDDYLSDDRAVFIAENEANSVENYMELRKAQEQGYKYKTWRTMLDKKVRHSHVGMENKTIPIEELFDVNGSMMMQPKDYSFGADAKEVVNCRCVLKFKK